MSEIVVVGCGAIGLTSALAIQRRIKNAKVTIITKDVTPNTTSDVAAGYWMPYLLGGTPPEKIDEWSKATYDYILRLWKQGKAKEAGISLQLAHRLFERHDAEEVPPWKNFVIGYSQLPREYLDQIRKQCKRKFVNGFSFMSFTWEGSIFLPFLEQEFLGCGGKIVKKTIRDFSELKNFDVIVNCTGLAARKLTGDSKVCPYRGQIARVNAPWQFHTYLITSDHDRSFYIIPNTDCVILGGTSQPVYNTEVDDRDKANIFRNCSDLVPALATTEVIKHQVGLRPGREKVRLDVEIVQRGKNDTLRIVHNYGHGGAGITLCVGCAEDCAELTGQVLNGTKIRSKM